MGETGPPGERGEKGEMGLSGPAVSSDNTRVSLIYKQTKWTNSWKFILLSVRQGMDGHKGEKGDCRMDDNLVSVTHTQFVT